MLPDIDQVSAIIREVCATEVMPRFRRLDANDIREKAPGDLVTAADEAAERRLTERLTTLVPGSVVIGEEAVAADQRILGRIFDDAPVWIVDPVDGTSNFVAGHPVFGQMVAFARAGRTLAGWIYDPCGNRMATAVQGQGAWLDGVRQRVAGAAATGDLRGSLAFGGFDKALKRQLETVSRQFAEISSLRCAAHEYLRLAGGGIHFALFRKVMPWDHAAGTLLHAEAGGYHAKLDGGSYSPTEVGGGLLLAPDRATWIRLRDLLFDTDHR